MINIRKIIQLFLPMKLLITHKEDVIIVEN